MIIYIKLKLIALKFKKNRGLIYSLLKREILSRYKGSFLGVLWPFILPLIMLGVFSFVFGIIFKPKWLELSESKLDFPLLIFLGLIIFNLFAESLSRAPNLIVWNVSYVKKIVFPLEILPLVSIGSALFHATIGLFVWVVFYFFFYDRLNETSILLPLVLLPLVILTIGISWVLSSVGVYVRDCSHVMGSIISGLMFVSPIFYPLDSVPEKYRFIIQINPISIPIEMTREVLFFGNVPSPKIYLLYLLISTLIAIFGYIFFQKTRKGFSDVL
jgi:lipopolysaccharide transport system permease protein